METLVTVDQHREELAVCLENHRKDQSALWLEKV